MRFRRHVIKLVTLEIAAFICKTKAVWQVWLLLTSSFGFVELKNNLVRIVPVGVLNIRFLQHGYRESEWKPGDEIQVGGVWCDVHRKMEHR